MELNEPKILQAFKVILGFDISNLDEVCKHSFCVCRMGDSLEKAREAKAAYDCLKENFGWKENFSIFKYPNAFGKGVPGYAVENDCLFSIPEIEKVE